MHYGSIQSQSVTSYIITIGPTYGAQSSWQSTPTFRPIQGSLTNLQFLGQFGGSTEFPPIERGEFEVPPSEDQNRDKEKFEEQSDAECNELKIMNVSASGFESDPSDYHPPSDAIDEDSSTWWSNNGKDPWVQIDLGESYSVCSISIEWNKGDKRDYSFEVEVSEDGIKYDKVFEGKNEKGSTEKENYQFDDRKSGQYIKLTITDTSSKDGWTSIQEISAMGQTNLQFLG